MQVNGAIIRIVAILLMFLLFIQVVNPTIVQVARLSTYQIFSKGAQAYLDLTTRNYESLEGQNFIIKYTAKDQAIAPLVLQASQSYYEELQQKLGFSLPQTGKRLIVIYPDNISLNKSFGWDSDQRAVGVYWAGSIRLLSPQEWLQGSTSQEMIKAFTRENPLTHELTHMLVDYRTGGNYTRWLTEGLAQYMETEITGYTLPEPEMQQSDHISIESIDAFFDDEVGQLQAYRQSRVMVNYLVQEYGLESLNKLLVLLRQGKNMQISFVEAYGFSPERLADLTSSLNIKVAQD